MTETKKGWLETGFEVRAGPIPPPKEGPPGPTLERPNLSALPEWARTPLEIEFNNVKARTSPGSVIHTSWKLVRMILDELCARNEDIRTSIPIYKRDPSLSKEDTQALEHPELGALWTLNRYKYIDDSIYAQAKYIVNHVNLWSQDADMAARVYYFAKDFAMAVFDNRALKPFIIEKPKKRESLGDIIWKWLTLPFRLLFGFQKRRYAEK